MSDQIGSDRPQPAPQPLSAARGALIDDLGYLLARHWVDGSAGPHAPAVRAAAGDSPATEPSAVE